MLRAPPEGGMTDTDTHLITIGAYSQGSDPRIDRAIIQKPYLDQFLQQKMREVIHYDEGLQSLQLVAMPLMR